jgi:hypothetical protein
VKETAPAPRCCCCSGGPLILGTSASSGARVGAGIGVGMRGS